MPFISDQQIARVQSNMATLAARANRVQTRIREQAARQAANVRKGAGVVGGGAAIGFIRGKYEADGSQFVIPGTTIDIELVAGAVLSGVAMMELAGKYSDDVMNIGSGILAHYAGQMLRNYGKTGGFQFTPISGGATGLIAGHHNYPTMAGGATDLIGQGGMSSALQSALSATV